MLVMIAACLAGATHHFQHCGTAGAHKPNDQNEAKGDEDQVEDRRVIPSDRLFNHLGSSFVGNEMQRAEEKLDSKRSACH